ncbi:conserved hypothetical protein [Luminiphilus syltensis NOR5-1B]|uniref:Choice-of-anchor D domain-containing protein n=1 Tax=Luminiphilus syltensis NOR5-1B TaxID=565045 RepID=B8KVM5_9GAMM|nr:choice-of-anchor D domain-containing protein [Luminiphilus syltensis]EED34107.1 conserved hypothetical protein [Luminiphilus syltensis NOR5-1B]
MKAKTNLTASVFILLALLFSSGAQAVDKTPPFTQADCADPTLNLIVGSQADVDSFPCTTVAGALTLSDSSTSPIVSLSPLNNLTRVDGQLRILLSVITSLDGLDNVTHVGSLSINNGTKSNQLTDISALDGLTSLGPRKCQPGVSSGDCLAELAIVSSTITQLPAWNIAGGTALEKLSLDGLPLADPAQLGDLPVPTKELTLGGLPLDTDQTGQLPALARIASAAQESVKLAKMAGVKALPAMPQTAILQVDELGLPDLSDITAAAFPALTGVVVTNLAGIDPAELAPIRDIESITFNTLPGLTGPNPLAGLTGGTFNALVLNSLTGVGTLADLSTVTSLEGLTIKDLDALTDLDGLQNLMTISQTLRLQSNAKLKNLNGLRNLVTGTLEDVDVTSNNTLTDITGLAGITGVSNSVVVYQNAVTECDVLVKSRLNPQPKKFYYVDPPCVYAAPTLTSSATALDFGSAPIGSTIDLPVTFQNSTGSISTTVDISAVSISGDSLGEYSVLSEDCSSGPLTGGSTRNACTVNVRFTVIQQGVDNAQLDLTYTTSDNSTPQSFPVTLTAAGTGVTGDQLIPKDKLDFDQVKLGASKTDTITIDNTGGSGPLTVSALTVTGADFTLSDNSCGNTYPQSVAAGSQCAITIRFAPSALGARSGLFTMDSDGATSPDSVTLLGSGVEPPAPLPSKTSLDFGDVPVGTVSPRQLVVVKNASPISSLPLGQLSASGDFALQSDTCSGATLTPVPQNGSLCLVFVTFNPTTTGPATGTLTIPGASGFPSANVALAGNGLQPASLTANPTILAFGTQTQPATLDVTITNIGGPGQDAQIGTASVTGTVTPQQFGIGVGTDTCSGTTLASQASCQISVTFDPEVEGVDTGSLDIPYNGGQTLNVALSGRGGDPVDYITPPSLSFGDIEIGSSSAPQTVTVTDNSGIALDIANVFSNDSAFSVQNDSCSGTRVAPNTSCTFEVVFTAVTRGHIVSTVDVISNSASSPDQVAVDGRGLAPGEAQVAPGLNIAFGDVAPGQNVQKVATITNIGDQPLPLGTLALSGDSAFSVPSDACSGQTLVNKGDNCAITVAFSPSGLGDVSATLDINPTITLTGTGAVAAPPQAIPTLGNMSRLLMILIVLLGVLCLLPRHARLR